MASDPQCLSEVTFNNTFNPKLILMKASKLEGTRGDGPPAHCPPPLPLPRPGFILTCATHIYIPGPLANTMTHHYDASL